MKSLTRSFAMYVAIVGAAVAYIFAFSAIIHFTGQFVDQLFGGVGPTTYLAIIASLTVFATALGMTMVDYIASRR
jgi:hypothetical protein